ncbi:hypothetical protein Nepgr_004781 [Nepenthes gracilis]|uniref:Uncharacterized protein n=1 Tax=Nepenthes gracilis TaxID=150966 RepID=A0AAD3S283_NEPGR|nr:hypothetical protein Nepgr_004781 [Nepenthes gracilis]
MSGCLAGSLQSEYAKPKACKKSSNWRVDVEASNQKKLHIFNYRKNSKATVNHIPSFSKTKNSKNTSPEAAFVCLSELLRHDPTYILTVESLIVKMLRPLLPY